MEEMWKNCIVNGQEALTYKISNFGRVYNEKTKRYLKGYPNNKGYQMVHLRMEIQKLCSVHRLVMNAFKSEGNLPNIQINHIDGNKLNNHIDNLEWCTSKENIHHSFETNLNPNDMKIVYQYDLNGNFIKEWANAHEAEIFYVGKNQSCIWKCAKSGTSASYGYMWRYFKKDKISPFIAHNCKAVYVYHQDSKELYMVFNSRKDAASHFNTRDINIIRYCNGTRKPSIPYFFTSEPPDIKDMV